MAENEYLHEIMHVWLKERGYDGLCNPGIECGCGLDDFMPCGSPNMDCEPAHLDDATPEEQQDLGWDVVYRSGLRPGAEDAT